MSPVPEKVRSSRCDCRSTVRGNDAMGNRLMKKPREVDGDRLSAIPATDTGPTTASILIVDDEPLIRETLAEYLSQEGFSVIACGDGEEALRLAVDRCFDV